MSLSQSRDRDGADRGLLKKNSIFLRWLPLALMWILIAIEQPAIAAVVARMSDAELQLAAFGVAFSLALFIEGPVIQMLAAGTALADCHENYKRLFDFMTIIGVAATGIHLLLCFPGIFNPFAERILGIPDQLLLPSRRVMVSMIPWTLSIGYRRLWQGVLIRHGKTTVIPVTMAVRIAVSFATLAWGYLTKALPAATLGGLSLSNGVVAGAIVAYLFTRPVLKNMKHSDLAAIESVGGSSSPPILSRKTMALFYLPLALTNFITLGARPLMQMGLARGPLALESLAIWPVSMGYLFLYTSLSLSAQEIVIAELNGPETRKIFLKFIRNLAIVISALYLIVLYSPLRSYWFSKISGLEQNLTVLLPLALILSFPVVPLSAYISLYRGALVSSHRTGEVTVGVMINVSVLLVTLFVGVSVLEIPAVSIVAASYALAFAAEFLFLLSRRPLRAFASVSR